MELKDIKEIEVCDLQVFLKEVEKQLVIDPLDTAVVTIEMTGRRLNEKTPLPAGSAQALLEKTARLLTFARTSGIPVIHVMSALRAVELQYQEQSKWRKAMKSANASISPYGEVPCEYAAVQDGAMEPDFAVNVGDSDFIIKTKKGFSGFYQTDLEWFLTKVIKRKNIVLAGLNTNADILATAYDGSNMGFGVIVVKECVASVYGDDLHEMALEQIGRCQGFVVDIQTFENKVSAHAL